MANLLESIPSEIFIQIARFLEPQDIVRLQAVSRRFLDSARDDTLWREQCFLGSSFLTNLRRRQDIITSQSEQETQFRDLARALAIGNGLGDSRLAQPQGEDRDFKARSNERIRILANWDPSYPNEKIHWYDEYIARHSPISTSWLEQPRNRDSTEHEYLEIRGMGVYTPGSQPGSTMIVAPLDDGSICLWNISSDHQRKGSIVARSRSGLISVGLESSKGSEMINTGITECVSVDSAQNRAYFAVHRGLVEVDLETLATVSHERFPFPITTLSEAKHPVPLTVGTNIAIYLHDPRRRSLSQTLDPERLESYIDTFNPVRQAGSLDFRRPLDTSLMYTHLHQPGPLSILHLPCSGNEWDSNGDIYVAGRFSNILNYDRRFFPRLRGTIHSGAKLCGLASLPFPFTSMEKDLARRGELSIEQVSEAKNRPGKTLIACGEYNSKGSLEMYGLSPNPGLSNEFSAGSLQNSVMKNRQTSSSSKLLSVTNHGTRIVVSDGGGNIKWFERDGFTEARRWNIAHGSVEAPRGIFGTLGDSYMDSGTGDLAIKLANTRNGRDGRSANEDDLIFWTGEKIGLLSFSNKPGFTANSFEEVGHKTPEEARQEREERTYSETMGRALEANANEVRWLRGLGLGYL